MQFPDARATMLNIERAIYEGSPDPAEVWMFGWAYRVALSTIWANGKVAGYWPETVERRIFA